MREKHEHPTYNTYDITKYESETFESDHNKELDDTPTEEGQSLLERFLEDEDNILNRYVKVDYINDEEDEPDRSRPSRTELITHEDGSKYRTFKIGRCPHEEKLQVYKKATHSFKPGVTVLVGCNGSGKTTLLQTVQDILNEERIPVYEYNNLSSGGSNARERALFYGRLNLLAEQMTSSEGENIIINIGTMAQKLGNFVKKQIKKEKKEIWILLDAIDSGLSIDYIEEVKDFIHNTLLKSMPNDLDCYILISSNNYELCVGEQCYNSQECKYIEIDSYENFRKVVKKTRQNKSMFIKHYNEYIDSKKGNRA